MKPTLLLPVVLVFAACEQAKQPTDGSQLLPAGDLTTDAASSGQIIQVVSGSGNFTAGGELRTFSFTAERSADGSIRGQWERFTRVIDARSHGSVTCLTVKADTAWLGGLTETTNSFGGEVGWFVIDHGQGAGAPPDQISAQFVDGEPGSAAEFCATTPHEDFPIRDVEEGNIQILP